LKTLSKEIAKNFTNISSALLIRRFPDRIEVNIILRKPLAKIFLSAGKLYYLDSDATLFSENSTVKHFKNLPIIKGAGSNPSKTKLKRIVSLLQSIDKINFQTELAISKINIDDRGELIFYLDEGFYVKIGSRDFKKRLDRLKLLLNEASFDLSKLKYIDIRFKEPSLVYN